MKSFALLFLTVGFILGALATSLYPQIPEMVKDAYVRIKDTRDAAFEQKVNRAMKERAQSTVSPLGAETSTKPQTPGDLTE